MVQCNKKGNIFPMLEKSEQVRPVCCHISVLPSSRSFTRNRESIAIEVITYESPIVLFEYDIFRVLQESLVLMLQVPFDVRTICIWLFASAGFARHL